MSRRDLHADLAICNAATAGPWRTSPDGRYSLDIVSIPEQVVICSTDSFGDGAHDARFIAEARTGWPHAIGRALEAEREADALRVRALAAERKLAEAESEVERLRGVLEYFAVSPIFRFVESPHSLRQMAQMALRKEATTDDQAQIDR
ncbi:hypothetical protein V5G20_18055 [Brevibacillus borstelensis]|uniref:hypothetical protein n=1 Tax=Brevibacillus borstelensis TaxID=45462 RepID=UPI0030CB346A